MLENFEIAVRQLKEAYAEKEGVNSNYLMIICDDNGYTTIVPTNKTGSYIGAFRN